MPKLCGFTPVWLSSLLKKTVKWRLAWRYIRENPWDQHLLKGREWCRTGKGRRWVALGSLLVYQIVTFEDGMATLSCSKLREQASYHSVNRCKVRLIERCDFLFTPGNLEEADSRWLSPGPAPSSWGTFPLFLRESGQYPPNSLTSLEKEMFQSSLLPPKRVQMVISCQNPITTHLPGTLYFLTET